MKNCWQGQHQIRKYDHWGCIKGLNHNLISISKLCDKSFTISFEESKWIGESKDKSQSSTGIRYGNIYLLDVTWFLKSIKDEKELWHRKLGHVNRKQISTISFKDLVCDYPKIKSEKSESCNACSFGKEVKSSFRSIDVIPIDRTIQLLHMDLSDQQGIQVLEAKGTV